MANPWFALYAGDFDAKTAHLTMVEDGAYNRLLRQYYRTGKPLPANAEVLLRVCRSFADDEKAATLKVLHEFFVLEEDGWHNKRADEELSKSSQISEKRRDAGKRGAAKTNLKYAGIAEAIARQMPGQVPTQPQPQPQPQSQPHIKESKAKRSTSFPDGYQPNQDHKNLSTSLAINLREEFPRFKDYCLSNGKTYRDWDAALRNWIRTASSFAKAKPSKPILVSSKNPADEMRRQLEAD